MTSMIAGHTFTEKFALENLAAHRAHLLLTLLPKAVAFGAAEVLPDYEPLTVNSSSPLLFSLMYSRIVSGLRFRNDCRGARHTVLPLLWQRRSFRPAYKP